MKKRIMGFMTTLVIFTFAVVYTFPVLPVIAAPTKEEVQEEIDNIKTQKSEALQQAQQKETDITDLQMQIDALQYDIDEYTKKIDASQTELDETIAKKEKQEQTMKLRLRVMYEDNDTTYLNLILSGGSLTDILSRIEIVRQMSDYDQRMIDTLHELEQAIEEKKKTLEQEQLTLSERQAEIEEKKGTLESEKAALDALVAQLTVDENDKLEELRKIEEEERARQAAVMEELRKSQAASHSSGSQVVSGRFGYPASSTTITSPYGYRIHPIYGTRKLHTGIDFPASTGSPIYATADGTVITAGWVSGYGNTVIIDHGGGVTSLYAHNSSLNVSPGTKVTQGTRIANAGSTGNSTGPHCHFEIRVNGATVDPMGYLR